MTKKTISISKKPGATKEQNNVDDWVTHRETSQEIKMKRLTIDIPQDLHSRIKVDCAARGKKMADEIREILNQKFPQT